MLRPATKERAERLAERLRLSNQERERLLALVTTELPDGDDRVQRRALHRLGAGRYRDLVRLELAVAALPAAEGQRRLALAERWEAPVFPLSGADLLALGVPEGRELGRILAQVRQAWEDSDFALTRAACLERARDLTP